ncbi:gp53-like domain-containing protein [Erwinia sp. V71]|uniref:gp53-like domain-containing protein n=1 Tax=Erwinia sp. V71 TaxID=3369424 RepID=UPI003F602337
MNRTDSPKKQAVPFGVNGQREDLLATTPAGDNTASYDAGFPPVTMILKAAGGLPPKGQDMNQILYELSSLARWSSAGALNTFDATFSTAIGGYPKGAVLLNDAGTNIFISTVEANTNNPNSSSTGWLSLLSFIGAAPLASPTFTGDPKAPTPAAGDNDTSIATTAFVVNALASLTGYLKSANNLSDLTDLATARSNLGLGTAALRAVGTGTNQIPDMNSFAGYFTSSASWQRLPGGLILQWGVTDAITAEALYTQALPLTFPNMCFMAQATINYSAAVSGVANHYIASISTTQIQIRSDVNGSGIAAMPSYWFAIGY